MSGRTTSRFPRTRAGVWILSLLVAGACTETDQEYYESLKDASVAGAINRGWVPEVLPSDSRAILERHVIDTGELWGRFTTRSGAGGRCSPVAFALVRDPGVQWWPRYLRGQVHAGELTAEGVTLYRCDGRHVVYLALRTSTGEAYYWHNP